MSVVQLTWMEALPSAGSSLSGCSVSTSRKNISNVIHYPSSHFRKIPLQFPLCSYHEINLEYFLITVTSDKLHIYSQCTQSILKTTMCIEDLPSSYNVNVVEWIQMNTKKCTGCVFLLTAMPFFIEQPTNIHSSEEEDAEFVCKAGGSPKPTIHWSINGIPVESKALITLKRHAFINAVFYSCGSSDMMHLITMI